VLTWSRRSCVDDVCSKRALKPAGGSELAGAQTSQSEGWATIASTPCRRQARAACSAVSKLEKGPSTERRIARGWVAGLEPPTEAQTLSLDLPSRTIPQAQGRLITLKREGGIT